ncbi:MAG: aldehyde ferredoxin oxidoreductase N-terminal domain-containing protein, partial [Promethearchaeota archaeon]
MIFGNMGKFLKIDLSTEKIEKGDLNQDSYNKYIGGWGINNKLFYESRVPEIDPFDPNSPIIIGVGA